MKSNRRLYKLIEITKITKKKTTFEQWANKEISSP